MRRIMMLTFIVSGLVLGAKAEEAFKDGVYLGEARGYKGPVRVAVTVKDGLIEKAEVTGSRDNRPRNALTDIPARIVSNNCAKVDAVTGATITSRAIMAATQNALDQAK